MRIESARAEAAALPQGRRGARRALALGRTSLVAATLVAGLGATSPRSALAADVAVLLSADVPAYREAVAGFASASGHRVTSVENMNGQDLERGRRILEGQVQAGADMILAVGVWALQAVADFNPPVPVVYTMVLNPPSVLSGRGADFTGSSMNVPATAVLDLVAELPDVRRIGVVYNPRTTGFLVQGAQDLAEARGFALVARAIATPAEALAAIDDLEGDELDILWIVPDADTLGDKVIDRMLLFSYKKGVPLLGVSDSHAKKGAVLALTFASSEDIGRQAGELSKKVLGPTRGKGIAFTMVRDTSVIVNAKAAKKMGLEIPGSLVGRATGVIR